MTIVAADAVPTKLLTVTCLDVNLGQRCAQSFCKVSCCRVQTSCRVQTLFFARFQATAFVSLQNPYVPSKPLIVACLDITLGQ